MPVLTWQVDVVCNRDGYEQDIEVVLDAEMIEMMIRDELDDLSVHPRSVYKTKLRRLGEALNPSSIEQAIYKKHARTTSQPPYTPAENHRRTRLVRGLGRVRKLRAALECGAGVRRMADESADEWAEVVKYRG